MFTYRRIDCRSVGLLGVLAILSALMVMVVPNAQTAWADEAFKGGDFVPLESATLADTRDGTGVRQGKIGADRTLTFQVTNRGGVPLVANVRAVAVRVAIMEPTTETAITLYPSGQSRPGVYHAFSSKDDNVSNSALVEVGSDGKITMRNRSGDTHVAIYVRGYFTKSTTNPGKGGLLPTDHTVILDTWTGTGGATAIAANGTTTKKITGGVIPTGTRAAFVDLTVSSPNQGYLTMATDEDPTFHPAIGFSSGATQSGLALPISADGTIKIHNSGPSLVNYRMTVHGYFSASYNIGGGFVPAVGRLWGTNTLGPNSEIAFNVKGQYGVPSHGVSAFAVNLNATSGTGTGRLRIKPCAADSYVGYAGRFDTGASRSTQSIVKADCGGVVIRNDSAESVALSVDLQGWFATKMPVLDLQHYSRSAAVEVSPGLVEHAYVDNVGMLRYGRQTSAGNYRDVQWEQISDGKAYTGQPGLTSLSSTTTDVRVAALNIDNDVWTRDEQAGTVPWQPWMDHRAPMRSAPVIGTEPNGTKVVFALNPDGVLWDRPMSGSQAYWDQLVTTANLNAPTAITMPDGIRIFATDSSGVLRTGLYAAGALTAGTWTAIGTGFTGTPAVIKYPGDRMRIFARQADGRLATTLQATDGTFTQPWTTVGEQVITGSPSAVLDPVAGRAEVVALAGDGEIRSTGETAQGSGLWREWVTAASGSATEPTVVPLTGQADSWLIVHRDANNVPFYTTVRTQPFAATESGQSATFEPPTFTTGKTG